MTLGIFRIFGLKIQLGSVNCGLCVCCMFVWIVRVCVCLCGLCVLVLNLDGILMFPFDGYYR